MSGEALNEEEIGKRDAVAKATIPNQRIVYSGMIDKKEDKARGNVNARLLIVGEHCLFTAEKKGKSYEAGNVRHFAEVTEILESAAELTLVFGPKRLTMVNANNAALMPILMRQTCIALGTGTTKIMLNMTQAGMGFLDEARAFVRQHPTRCFADCFIGRFLYEKGPKEIPNAALISFLRKLEAPNARSQDLIIPIEIAAAATFEADILTPLTAALGVNDSFKIVDVSGSNKNKILDSFAVTLATNESIEGLSLALAGPKNDCEKLGKALEGNPRCAVGDLNISGTVLKDKGFLSLLPGLMNLSRLHHLDLSNCDLTSKGAQAFFADNPRRLTTLSHINLSDNRIGKDGTVAMTTWLRQPGGNNVVALLLHNCDLDIDTEFLDALTPQFSPRLHILDIGGNLISDMASVRLRNRLPGMSVIDLDVSGCTGSLIALSNIVNGMAFCGRQCSINSSAIDISRPPDYAIMSAAVEILPFLHTLCLEDCNLGVAGLQSLIDEIKKTPGGIRRLHLSGNVLAAKTRPKGTTELMSAIGAYLASSPLEVLSLRGSEKYNMGESLSVLLDGAALATNLHELDISGNRCPKAASQIAAIVAHSLTLRVVHFDENMTKMSGLKDVMLSVAKSRAPLLHVDVPTEDLQAIRIQTAKDGIDLDSALIEYRVTLPINENLSPRVAATWGIRTSIYSPAGNLSGEPAEDARLALVSNRMSFRKEDSNVFVSGRSLYTRVSFDDLASAPAASSQGAAPQADPAARQLRAGSVMRRPVSQVGASPTSYGSSPDVAPTSPAAGAPAPPPPMLQTGTASALPPPPAMSDLPPPPPLGDLPPPPAVMMDAPLPPPMLVNAPPPALPTTAMPPPPAAAMPPPPAAVPAPAPAAAAPPPPMSGGAGGPPPPPPPPPMTKKKYRE